MRASWVVKCQFPWRWSVYRAELIGEPRDDFESTRRECVPLKSVPDLVARGEVRSANAVAALLMLHHLRLG